MLGLRLGLILALAGGLPRTMHAQRAGGSIGVSITIVESVETRAMVVTGLRLEHDGRVILETVAPKSDRVSRLVMARVSGAENGFQPAERAFVLLPADRGGAAAATTGAGVRRPIHRAQVGRVAPGAAGRDMVLSVECLVFAGT